MDVDSTKQSVDESNKRAALLEQSNTALHVAITADNLSDAKLNDELTQAVNNKKRAEDLAAKENAKKDQAAFDKYVKDHHIIAQKEFDKIDAQAAATKAAKESKDKIAKAKLDEKTQALLKHTFNEELVILQNRDKAYATSSDKLAAIFSKNSEMNKAAVLAKKAFAIAEIGISTEQTVASYIKATANAVENDMQYGFPVGPILAAVDIAGGAIEVAAAISTGAKQIANINTIPISSAAGFAKGGLFQSDGRGALLSGPGTGTSDSINAKLSNGESIINARSTQMFWPVLSAINQLGGGVAFHHGAGYGYAQGGLFNGSNTFNDSSNDLANTRAMTDMVKIMAASMPRQVLVVEDVQASLQNKVMLHNMSNF